jgi:hypothetical protein
MRGYQIKCVGWVLELKSIFFFSLQATNPESILRQGNGLGSVPRGQGESREDYVPTKC